MEKIKSFQIDHTVLTPGFYISRQDGDVTTYDLRTRRPNAGDYMSNSAMHSVEHMFATFIRNSEKTENVIYFGPMGCQTGFYLLMRSEEPKAVFELTKKVLRQILDYDGPVFGASAKECGNYANLDLTEAKRECEKYLRVLENADGESFDYPKGEEE